MDILTITIIVMISALFLAGGWWGYRYYCRAAAMANMAALAHAHTVYSGSPGPNFHPTTFDPNQPLQMLPKDDTAFHIITDPNENSLY